MALMIAGLLVFLGGAFRRHRRAGLARASQIARIGPGRWKLAYSPVSLIALVLDRLGIWRGARKSGDRVGAAELGAARGRAVDRHRLRSHRSGLRSGDADQGGARASDDGRRRVVGARPSARERPAQRGHACSARFSSGPSSTFVIATPPRSAGGDDVCRGHASSHDAIAVVVGVVVSHRFRAVPARPADRRAPVRVSASREID